MDNIKKFLEFIINEDLNFESLKTGFKNATTKFSNINLSGEDKDSIIKTNLKNYIESLFNTVLNNSEELKNKNDEFIDDIISEFGEFKEKINKYIEDTINDPNLTQYISDFIDNIIIFFQNTTNRSIIGNLDDVSDDQKENKFRENCDNLQSKIFLFIDNNKKIEKIENNFSKDQLIQMVNKGIVYFKLDEYDDEHKDKIGNGVITKYDSDNNLLTINDSDGKIINKKLSDILKIDDLVSINDKIKMNLSNIKDDSKSMSLILKFIDFVKNGDNTGNSSIDQIKKLLDNVR